MYEYELTHWHIQRHLLAWHQNIPYLDSWNGNILSQITSTNFLLQPLDITIYHTHHEM